MRDNGIRDYSLQDKLLLNERLTAFEIVLMKSPIEQVKSSLLSALLKHGLDLVLPFSVLKYNSLALEHSFQPLPLPSKENSLALLIGNTRYLWPHFISHLQRKSESFWEQEENPLDDYVTTSVESAVKHALADKKTEIRFSHIFTGDDFVAVQHAGQLAGLIYDQDLGFCLHPTYGPWIGLRAVVIVGDVESFEASSFDTKVDSLMPSETLKRLKREMKSLRAQWKQDPEWTWEKYWTQWAALRDQVSEACSTQQWRYSAEQIEYHYLKDRTKLKEVVKNSSSLTKSCPSFDI